MVSLLIERLKIDGIDVVAIKHHGHGGKPDILEQKDSSKHLKSGAVASIVEGEGSLLLQAEKPSWTLEDQIQLSCFFHPDLIVIEGYKNERFPKLLIIRDKKDLELLKKVANVQMIVVWDQQLKQYVTKHTTIPSFHINGTESIISIVNYIKRHLQ